MVNLEEGDLVLCTVENVESTIVFVKIEGNGEGSIITSEIAPGRIRNLRDYVVPGKKIVCKVLKIDSNGNIHLSLRRVSQKETKEVMEEYDKEKKCLSILKSILGEKTEKVLMELEKKGRILNCLYEAKENPAELEKIVGKENTEKIIRIISAEKTKKKIIKKEIRLTSSKPNGLSLIKEILSNNDKEIRTRYLGAGNYSLEIESTELKKADQKLNQFVRDIEQKAKKEGMDFYIRAE